MYDFSEPPSQKKSNATFNEFPFSTSICFYISATTGFTFRVEFQEINLIFHKKANYVFLLYFRFFSFCENWEWIKVGANYKNRPRC